MLQLSVRQTSIDVYTMPPLSHAALILSTTGGNADSLVARTLFAVVSCFGNVIRSCDGMLCVGLNPENLDIC